MENNKKELERKKERKKKCTFIFKSRGEIICKRDKKFEKITRNEKVF